MHFRTKKRLGQHFLKDKNLALQIVDLLEAEGKGQIIEIGPGKGILSGYLLERFGEQFHAVEVDLESVDYLKENLPDLTPRLFSEDFLKFDLSEKFKGDLYIIGNFPYNISSQILFRVLLYRDQVKEVVGMFQREVARRISTGPGSKAYGILSVLLGAYYDISYHYSVSENVFSPPPKVKSAVIRLKRNNTTALPCDENLFFRVVKMSFNQRRKTLRNSLSTLIQQENRQADLLSFRPEQLSVESFFELTNFIDKQIGENLEGVS